MSPTSSIEESIELRIERLDSKIGHAIFNHLGGVPDWMPQAAKERLALGEIGKSHPFDRCMTAAHQRHPEILKLLLDLGYAPKEARRLFDHRLMGYDPTWKGLASECCAGGMIDSLKRLLPLAPLNGLILNHSLLTMAAANGRDHMGLALLEWGASAHGVSGELCSPIVGAAIGNCFELTLALLARGLDPATAHSDGFSAIDRAYDRRSSKFLAALEVHALRQQVQTGVPDRRGRRSL